MPLIIRDIDRDRAHRFIRALDFQPMAGEVVLTDVARAILLEVAAEEDLTECGTLFPNQNGWDNAPFWYDPADAFLSAVAQLTTRIACLAQLEGSATTGGHAGEAIDVMRAVADALSVIDRAEGRRQWARDAALSA